MYRVGIITCSDKGAVGERVDLSGPAIIELLPQNEYEIVSYNIVSDDKDAIVLELKKLCDELDCNLVLTTGGTGFSKRDNTPEATIEVAERMVPGIAEAIRAYSLTITKRAMLSRGVSGIRGNSLIINLPGSPKAVKETLSYLLDCIPHGLDILLGEAIECARTY